MKYRVRIDMSFENETDAQVLMNTAIGATGKAISLSENQDKTAPSFCELELCRHDEGLPCIRLDRVEAGGGEQP
jgi:hypothetical protein